MIRNFRDKETERLANGTRSRKFPPEIQQRAMVLLRIMMRVEYWNDLRHSPGNRLHALFGDRKGRYAIRINRQWWIAFTPDDGAMKDVKVTDYHG